VENRNSAGVMHLGDVQEPTVLIFVHRGRPVKLKGSAALYQRLAAGGPSGSPLDKLEVVQRERVAKSEAQPTQNGSRLIFQQLIPRRGKPPMLPGMPRR